MCPLLLLHVCVLKKKLKKKGYVGIICKDLSVHKVLERVSPEAALTCERYEDTYIVVQ